MITYAVDLARNGCHLFFSMPISHRQKYQCSKVSTEYIWLKMAIGHTSSLKFKFFEQKFQFYF